jgi:hypothetical protein
MVGRVVGGKNTHARAPFSPNFFFYVCVAKKPRVFFHSRSCPPPSEPLRARVPERVRVCCVCVCVCVCVHTRARMRTGPRQPGTSPLPLRLGAGGAAHSAAAGQRMRGLPRCSALLRRLAPPAAVTGARPITSASATTSGLPSGRSRAVNPLPATSRAAWLGGLLGPAPTPTRSLAPPSFASSSSARRSVAAMASTPPSPAPGAVPPPSPKVSQGERPVQRASPRFVSSPSPTHTLISFLSLPRRPNSSKRSSGRTRAPTP